MAKTVFGIPGIGEKSRETAGDAVAPGGTPGAKTREQLPQKSGKEEPSPSSDPIAAPEKPKAPEKSEAAQPEVAKSEAAKPEVPNKPETPKSAGSPMMAKPVAPPMAKPATPAKPAAQGAAGGKTMFGMPALKLPEAPGGAQMEPGGAPTEPAKAPWEGQQDAAEPDAKVESKAGDAYKATVLGMAAVDVPSGLAAAEEDTIPPEIEKTVSMPGVSDASPVQPPKKAAPPLELTSPVRGSARFPENVSSGKSSRALVIAIIVLFVVLIILVYYLFGSSDESGVSNVAPPPPAQAAPAVPAVPTAPNPGSAQ
jgi:hypothetical protein